MMKRLAFCLILVLCMVNHGLSQGSSEVQKKILFRGLIKDALTFLPINNSQITINGITTPLSGVNGNFSFYVNRNDTIVFKSLGYKPTIFHVNDTIAGLDYITGVYLSTDTISIGEVIILPRTTNLKSDILNAKSKTPANFDNARYNVAISAYQGRMSQGTLGDPTDNYSYLNQKQKVNAYEKGGIPSDKMIGFSSLLFLPAYMMIKGAPEVPQSFKPELTDQEVDQIHKKYLESLKNKK